MPTGNVTELKLTPQSAGSVIRTIAKESGRVFFSHHAEERMEQRGITRLQVLKCLRSGRVTEEPSKNLDNNCVVRMEGLSAGQTVEVVAELLHDNKGNQILVITTY